VTLILAAMAVALTAAQDAAPAPAPGAPADLQAIEVTAAGRIKGDMQTGILAYPPTFFTAVRPSTALDMITWLPGFTVEDTRDFRGLEGSTGNVLIDGKPPTSKTDTLLSVLRRIPSAQVERVDLIVGGAPGINMRGRNVIANLVLKPSPKPRHTVTGQTYLDKEGRLTPQLTLTRSNKHDGIVSEASLELSRNIAIFPGFGYGEMTRRDATGALLYAADESALYGGPSVVGSASYERPLGPGRFRISASTRYFGNDYWDRHRLTSAPGEYVFHHVDTYFQNELGLRYERTVGRITAELQGLGRTTALDGEDFNSRPPAVTTENIHADQTESVLRGVLRFKKDETFTLETFAEGAFNTSSNSSRGVVNGVPRTAPGFDIKEVRGETGATATWKPNAKFSLDAALKVEASELTASGAADLTRRFTYFKPKLAVSWAIDKRTQLRLRAEHEVGQVGFANYLTYSEPSTGQTRLGNPELRPNRAYVAEAVLQRSFWTGGDLSLTVRPRALRDVIDVAPIRTGAGVVGAISNIGSGAQTEVIANLTLPFKNLGLTGGTLKGSMTWRRMRVTDPLDGLPRGLSNQPARLAELHYAQDLPAWKLNLGLDGFYRGKTTLYRPFGNDTGGSWPRFNIFAEYRPTPTWTLRAEVQNLPGTKVRSTSSLYGGLRNAAPLTYVDDRRLNTNGPLLLVRLRRTLG
jgi:hypothetical protein